MGGESSVGGGGHVVRTEEDAGYQVDGEETDEEESGGRRREAGGRGWVVFAVLFIFQLTLPSILWSYGVLLSRMIEYDDVRFPVALWTPALFLATVCLADPWCRLPVMKDSLGKRRRFIATWMLRPLSVAGILLVAGSLAVTPYVRSRELHLVTYGVLSGLGTSLAVAQSELLLDQHFPPRRKRRRPRVLCLASIRFGCSLSQFVAPLLMLAVIETYGRHQAPLLQSGFVLQALIAAALIKFRSNGSADSRANVRMRSMSYSIMEEDEGTEDKKWRCGRVSEGDTLLPFEEDLAGRSWKNPARDDTDAYDLKDDDDFVYIEDPTDSASGDPGSSVLQQPKRRNCYGVEILPQIPEETEEEDSGDARQSKRSSRRLTITLTNNNNNHKDPSAIDNSSNGANFLNGNYLPDTPTSSSSTTFLITPNKGPRKYKRWKWRRRRRRMRREEEDVEEEKKRGLCGILREVIDPRGFCKASFYPALVLSASSKLADLVFFSLTPHVGRLLGKSKNDCTLLVSLAGFSSLLMASVIPLISLPSSKTKFAGVFAIRTFKKFVYCIGSIISAISLFLLSRCDTNDRLTLASLLFGIGSGATADTAGSILLVAYSSSVGVAGSRGLINILSSFIIIAFTASIGIYFVPAPTEVTRAVHGSGVGSLTVCFSIVAILQFMAAILCSIQPILSRFYRRQRNYVDWNTGMFLQAT